MRNRAHRGGTPRLFLVVFGAFLSCTGPVSHDVPTSKAVAAAGAAEMLHAASPASARAVRPGLGRNALSLPAQTGFSESTVFSGLTHPVAVRFAADGRVFVAEKGGRVLSYASLTATTPTVVADLSTAVYDFWDRGLLGFALDPNFPTSPWLYVLYTYDGAVGETAPRWHDACPTPPGPTTDGCIASGRLSRLRIDAGVMDSEQLLLAGWGQQYPSHSIGDLAFGPDGALYATSGDAASFTFADYGQGGNPPNPLGDPPVGVGGAQTPPTAEGGALRSQSFRRPSPEPVVLNGAVLRLDPATGLGMPDNPNAGLADPNAQRIIAYGLRNPFRFTVRPGTGELWVGDVGWNTWEEVDRIVDPRVGTANFGWPCYEGAGRQGGYDGANLALCETLYAGGATAWNPPYFTYNHSAQIVNGESCPTGSSSVSGLAFYSGGTYPPQYQGALFWGDHSRACIWAMLPGAGGLPDPAQQQVFVTGAPVVALQIGPGGDLFYADYDNGLIKRVSYLVSQAIASATPTGGTAPLTVAFDGTASTPGVAGESLAYAWDLDGDGQFNDATSATASFVYAAPGTFQARLQITDSRGAVALSAPIAIAVTAAVNTPPVPVIDTPASTFSWAVGDPIAFSGHAGDAEDGPLADAALSWHVVMHHCPSNCHTHDIQTFDGVRSGSFAAPDHDYPSWLELTLTATDSQGVSASTSVRLDPKTVLLHFASLPSGLQLSTGPTQGPTPFDRTVIVGSSNSLAAPTPQALFGATYDFTSWSDQGAATHNFVAPAAEATYTATFAAESTGLTGQYFDNADFTGRLLTRIDPGVGFDWGSGSPDPSMGPDTFSVRWTGQVQPLYSETYTFSTLSDDGVRLWVNGVLLVDNWTLHARTENAGTIALQAGQSYDVRLEYFENGGLAVAKLLWSSPSQAKEVIPAGRLNPLSTHGLRAEYFDNADLTASRLVRIDPAIDFDWGGGSPDPSIGPDTFSVRWSGQLEPRFTETYQLTTISDDGVRLWINGQLVVDHWNDHPPTQDVASLSLQAGQKYDLVLEMYENGGGAVARLLWSSPSQSLEPVPASQLTPTTANTSYGTGTGLKGDYFDNADFTNPVLTRVDPSVAFNWGRGSPAATIGADTFSVRWTGTVQPRFSETYRFTTTSDDGVRLWVNGVQLINDWTLHSARNDVGQIALQAGQKYSVVMEFFENQGAAVAKLAWSSPSQPPQIIPPSQLYPAP